jgi:hypothetical protein
VRKCGSGRKESRVSLGRFAHPIRSRVFARLHARKGARLVDEERDTVGREPEIEYISWLLAFTLSWLKGNTVWEAQTKSLA